jgi:2'-5' RNA ligase
MIRDGTFVLTLRMDEVSVTRLQQLRTRYFPPHVNFLPAHLTLVYALTAEQVARLQTAGSLLPTEPIPLEFARPTVIGRGVAIRVESNELKALHARMIEMLGPGLTRQDGQPYRPHVTIQDKVTREAAKATSTKVSTEFAPWTGQGVGLDVWRYSRGPWQPHSQMSFLS